MHQVDSIYCPSKMNINPQRQSFPISAFFSFFPPALERVLSSSFATIPALICKSNSGKSPSVKGKSNWTAYHFPEGKMRGYRGFCAPFSCLLEVALFRLLKRVERRSCRLERTIVMRLRSITIKDLINSCKKNCTEVLQNATRISASQSEAVVFSWHDVLYPTLKNYRAFSQYHNRATL